MTPPMEAVLAEPGYQRLLEILRELGSVAIAYSGGLDSSFLLAAAQAAVSERAMGLTASLPYMATWEIAEARELATLLGIRHQVLELPMPAEVKDNPPDRCYHCKKALFARLQTAAIAAGCDELVDGSNRDDLDDYRPGLRALRELGIRSPLLEAGLGKAEIRRYAQALKLPVWNKPAYACLLTRLPHDTSVQPERLRQVENAERALLALGFSTVRVRCHDDLARIELNHTEHSRLLDSAISAQVAAALTACGFRYVTLDLQGYRMGSFNVAPAMSWQRL